MILNTHGFELKILKGGRKPFTCWGFLNIEVPDFESSKGCCQIDDVSAFMSLNGFRDRGRYPTSETPSVGTSFEVIYERDSR